MSEQLPPMRTHYCRHQDTETCWNRALQGAGRWGLWVGDSDKAPVAHCPALKA